LEDKHIHKHPRRAVLMVAAVLAAIFLVLPNIRSDETDVFGPVTNDGRVWRIGYYQGGDYNDYHQNLLAMVDAFAEHGWMEPIDLHDFENSEDTSALWMYLSSHVDSGFIAFDPQAFWDANWDEELRKANRKDALSSLSAGDAVDLMIAMGTWAGQDLVNDQHDTPTIALTSSGPIEAGIIDTVEDSGYDHVLVEVDPQRYRRQIDLFHDIVRFKRLGVVFEDSPDGRVYANITDIEASAKARGFEVVSCFAVDDEVNIQVSLEEIEACHREIGPAIDALWMTAMNGYSVQYMPENIETLLEYNVPIWAPDGQDAVRRGALISIQSTDFDAAGEWYLEVIAKILHGIPPREISQVFEMPQRIVINAETARRIGFDIPDALLAAADTVYQSIEGE